MLPETLDQVALERTHQLVPELLLAPVVLSERLLLQSQGQILAIDTVRYIGDCVAAVES